ncbi:hypothetical protein ON010_g11880 [Phytophthora cinnamomi]|nr:hypothetical protein ON010_g11880 [Phytophthora cinnamomi]
METDGWGAREEKLLMFLCWRAKKDQEKFIEEGTEPWLEVTNELNKHSKTNFDEEDVKSKYLQVMQDYEQFKRTTGFTGDAGTAPRYKKDWDLLIKERPECAGKLEKLRAKGGFPHVEVCSLIKGDKATDDTEPASVTEYLAKGKLQHVKAAKALPYILPATASTTTALKPPAAQSEPAVGTAAAGAGAAPAAFTQELHDNLNMFLKTATAYLVMLIDDHNKGSGM